MKFGTVPLAEARGGVLAHSLRLGGVSLKKGRRLDDDDLASLNAAELTEVTVARPEAGDVDEDRAAATIGGAVAGNGVSAKAPFTGRVNLLATCRGLVHYDADRLDALNLIDEAITVAALPPWQPVEPGTMVATIKIIPFFVAGALLERAAAIARSPVMRVAPYRPRAVGLVQTLLPGTRDKVLDKTVKVLRSRVENLSGSLAAEARCAHETDAIARAITEQLAAKLDLVLIAGASAITDRRDLVPSAIERAGGRILHFGMPVDPGNLLLLGEVDGVPVIGLPGCARSPKLNGFDWILGRLACGLPVTPDDIKRMGSGGLLTGGSSHGSRAGTGGAPRARTAALGDP